MTCDNGLSSWCLEEARESYRAPRLRGVVACLHLPTATHRNRPPPTRSRPSCVRVRLVTVARRPRYKRHAATHFKMQWFSYIVRLLISEVLCIYYTIWWRVSRAILKPPLIPWWSIIWVQECRSRKNPLGIIGGWVFVIIFFFLQYLFIYIFCLQFTQQKMNY